MRRYIKKICVTDEWIKKKRNVLHAHWAHYKIGGDGGEHAEHIRKVMRLRTFSALLNFKSKEINLVE